MDADRFTEAEMQLPDVMVEAELKMWYAELDATAQGRADWKMRKLAAQRICEIVGIAEAIRAVAMDGALRTPPAWPEVDLAVTGGGPGFVTFDVRTLAPSGAPLSVGMRIAFKGRNKNQEQIGEAMEMGKRKLHDLIHGKIRSVVPR